MKTLLLHTCAVLFVTFAFSTSVSAQDTGDTSLKQTPERTNKTPKKRTIEKPKDQKETSTQKLKKRSKLSADTLKIRIDTPKKTEAQHTYTLKPTQRDFCTKTPKHPTCLQTLPAKRPPLTNQANLNGVKRKRALARSTKRILKPKKALRLQKKLLRSKTVMRLPDWISVEKITPPKAEK